MPAYRVREIRSDDLKKGFLETLANLSEVGLDYSEGRKILSSIKRNPFHRIFVVSKDGEIVGATTLLVEPKFIHAGGLVAHIEDVSVRKGYEGIGIGGSVVQAAVKEAKRLGCYKVILDCNEKLVEFYGRLGFKRHGVEMRIDFVK
jgi:glucosamine-phosphate N-acetyltransferase